MQPRPINGNGRRNFIRQLSLAGLSLCLPMSFNPMINTEGIIIEKCRYSVAEAISQLAGRLADRGAKIYTVINQQEELRSAGITIPPMQFLLFGNPRAGGAILVQEPVAGLDLPLKILVWEDEQQQVHLAYNSADYVAGRFHLKPATKNTLDLGALVQTLIKT